MSESITFTVPLTPPSVNAYVRHTRSGRHYKTDADNAFKDAVKLFARGAKVTAKQYRVELLIFLGKDQRLDVDNGCKCSLDSLVAAGVIHSDAAIVELKVRKDRDWAKPRTIFTVEGL